MTSIQGMMATSQAYGVNQQAGNGYWPTKPLVGCSNGIMDMSATF